MAARVGVQLGSVYIRMRERPSSASFEIRGGAVTTDDIEIRHADFTKAYIINKDVDEIRRLTAVLLANLRELCIDFCIFFRPTLAMLGFQDVVLGVVDDLTFLLRLHHSSVQYKRHSGEDNHREPKNCCS